jgi:hypothetical protein
MKVVDQIFGWIMVVLGFVHGAFVFRAHGFDSLHSYFGVIIILLAGLINVSRAQAPKGLLKFTSIFANVVVLASSGATAFTLRSVLRDNLQVPILLVVAVIELAFSIWG